MMEPDHEKMADLPEGVVHNSTESAWDLVMQSCDSMDQPIWSEVAVSCGPCPPQR